ncbi:hypothetical protein HHS_07020 [Candidatus Pantoea carbekii]|uniref:Uncharacterized protein n=1 Tax=Candidatus Pantoea carbekii TaxID=1235990 RepID=U3U888_9GAMM|nr:hypothetical protein HHS_07020 [Candidatus Pantoea carbekii]
MFARILKGKWKNKILNISVQIIMNFFLTDLNMNIEKNKVNLAKFCKIDNFLNCALCKIILRF